MEELIETLKVQIIKQLNLEDVEPDEIDADEMLFDADGELGLDSIDALELIVLLDKEYGIKIKNQEEGKKIFHSLKTMAEFILQHQD
ncbi:MAG: phosphopantetheine-binding protein [Saprospiraceae bacterium]|nr:phosphopantetheine-binding protein [Saprospiraceae bacterium]